MTFHLIEDSSQKGKEKLADSNRYTYKRKQGLEVQCQKQDRLVQSQCHSEEAELIRGSNLHVHPAKLGLAAATRITSTVKKQAAAEIFTSAAEILNKVKIVYAYLYFEDDY